MTTYAPHPPAFPAHGAHPPPLPSMLGAPSLAMSSIPPSSLPLLPRVPIALHVATRRVREDDLTSSSSAAATSTVGTSKADGVIFIVALYERVKPDAYAESKASLGGHKSQHSHGRTSSLSAPALGLGSAGDGLLSPLSPHPSYKLVALSPWTRRCPAQFQSLAENAQGMLRFPGVLPLIYAPGEGAEMQVSVYRVNLGRNTLVASANPPITREGVHSRALSSSIPPPLSEDDRLGSATFSMDEFGLDSRESAGRRMLDSIGAAANVDASVQAAAAKASSRLYASRSAPHVRHLELHLSHDTDRSKQAALRQHASTVRLSVDTLTLTTQSSANPLVFNPRVQVLPELPSEAEGSPQARLRHMDRKASVDNAADVAAAAQAVDAAIEKMKKGRSVDLIMASVSRPGSMDFKLLLPPQPAAPVVYKPIPDAALVDVTGVDDSAPTDPALLARLRSMMLEGQTFFHHVVGSIARPQKLFFRPSVYSGSPGSLYMCDVEQSPVSVNLATTIRRVDLALVSDIYLGRQSHAFHKDGIAPVIPDVDDAISFSLVTSPGNGMLGTLSASTFASLQEPGMASAPVVFDLEAQTPGMRASWIIGVMGILNEWESIDNSMAGKDVGAGELGVIR